MCSFLLIVVCVNLWNECALSNMGCYTYFIFQVDGGALCSGLFFCLGEWGGKYEGSIYDWLTFVRALKIAFGNMA